MTNSQIDVPAKRYRFTGMERDDETGLAYHGSRYYCPWLGRWTAADPIGLGDGINRFRYVSNNPVGFVDTSGAITLPFSKKDLKRAAEKAVRIASPLAAAAEAAGSAEASEKVAQAEAALAVAAQGIPGTSEAAAVLASGVHIAGGLAESPTRLGEAAVSAAGAVEAAGRGDILRAAELEVQAAGEALQALSPFLEAGLAVLPGEAVATRAATKTATAETQTSKRVTQKISDAFESTGFAEGSVGAGARRRKPKRPRRTVSDTKADPRQGKEATAATATGEAGLPDESFVVRGGIATPEQIRRGIGPHRDIPEIEGFSAQSREGATVEELAATGGVGGGPFPHGKVSVTTVGEIRCLGCEVVATPGGGASHVTVVTGANITDELVRAISERFRVMPNPARPKK